MMTAESRALNVTIPTELYERLRQFAFDHRRSQAEVVREALKFYFTAAESQANE